MKIPSHIKAIIFDVDGLLIDSEPYWMKADAEFFARHDKKHTPEVNKKIRGMGHKEIANILKEDYGFKGDTEDLTAERKELLYEKLLPEISLMEGAKELILQLHEKHFPMAIATGGHSSEKVKELLDRLEIGEFFEAIISADQVAKGKPAPDVFLKAAASINIDPKECLVFEDAPNGVQAGKAAGMTVYGVNKEEWWRRELQASGADQVFTSLTDITV